MKILALNANIQGVGTYQRCYYFSREMARRGHEVTMATVSRSSKYQPRIYYKGSFFGESAKPAGSGSWIRVVEGPCFGHKWMPGWGSGPLDIWWRTKELWAGGYDLVYGFEYQPDVAWPFYLTRPLRHFRFVSDWCDWYAGESNGLRGWRLAHRIDGFLEERIRFFAQTVTVISQRLHRRAADIGVAPTRIMHIPQGCDTEYLQDFPREQVRRRHGLPSDGRIVLSVKDGDMSRTVRIFREVLRQVPEALLVLVGSCDDKAKAVAESLGIGGSLHWAGRVSDEEYPEYIGCADVCLLPLREGRLNEARFPGKLLDYLGSGRPVVTNPVGDVGDLLRTRELGLAAGQADEEIGDAVVTLLRDPERSRHLGANARKVMVHEWEWKLRGAAVAKAIDGTS
jgi:glycosyltransferase involved in cell wall biosynthesis